MKKIILGLILLSVAFMQPILAQSDKTLSADSILNVNGEVYFKFAFGPTVNLDTLTRMISIDNVKDGEVFAYANKEEFGRFLRLGIEHTILPSPGSLLTDEELNMGNWQKNSDNMTIWNFYPSYDQYLTIMSGFATNYPSICKLDTIGKTILGRWILGVKISDSVNYDRGAPQVFLSSSIHGDELTGCICMLHLIDTLLNSYGTSTRLTNIVNKTQLYICPMANPDGTYHGGNSSVQGAVRYNANGYDMNRNYADPRAGQHPDNHMWQPETAQFMSYADYHNFTLGMNFHGGAEVVNYPWDTWNSTQKITADDSWWQFVSNEYADTAQHYGPSGYFTDVDPTGITNGGDWYVITGGRQDYHNYFKHDREVTLEISLIKLVAAGSLLNFWRYNYRSFLNYIEQANYGINGKVYDSVTYAPIAAKVFINGFDADSSHVYSTLPSGWYFRMIDAGTKNLTFSAPGYYSRTITGVSSARYATTRLNVKLRPIDQYFPRNLFANAVSSHEIDLTWSNDQAGDPLIIAYSLNGIFGTPIGGTVYAEGSTITGGGFVIYSGSGTGYSHIDLSPGTTYYYRAWTVRPGNTYSAAASSSARTYCGSFYNYPYSQPFTSATIQLPDCWHEEISSSITQQWIRNNSNNAGGSAWEMRLSPSSSGTRRLITCAFNTVGINLLTLSFRYYVAGKNGGSGSTMKIQTSTDGVIWTDESWSFTTNNQNSGATLVTTNITNNLNSPTTYIAFSMTGDLSKFNFWYIDDVIVKAPGYWIGGTPGALTDWNTGTNWGDGVVPTASRNCYIPRRAYLPIVTNDPATPARCNNLTIESLGKVTVNAGKKLEVNGNLILKTP